MSMLRTFTLLAAVLLAGCASWGEFAPIYGNPAVDPYAPATAQPQDPSVDFWPTMLLLLALGFGAGAV